MSRILLADDSPHAQRMGELILREEGYEVVTVTDGATVLLRLKDVDPDLVMVDVTMPTRSGYEICEYVKTSLRHVHTRVVLLAGAQDAVDEREVRRVHADGVLKKPFEASMVIETVKPLLNAAAAARSEKEPKAEPAPDKAADMQTELVRAAVTIALDGALQNLIEEITRNVLGVLEAQGNGPRTNADKRG
jgi:DNA-binding response OmpR family regulator